MREKKRTGQTRFKQDCESGHRRDRQDLRAHQRQRNLYDDRIDRHCEGDAFREGYRDGYHGGGNDGCRGSYGGGDDYVDADHYSDDYDEEAARRAAKRRRLERRRRQQRINVTLVVALVVILLVVTILLVRTMLFGCGEDTPAATDAAQSGVVTAADAGSVTNGAQQGAKSDAATGLDTVPPVISGVSDKTIRVGDSIFYKEGVAVTDNVDADIEVEVDNSNVDLNTPGRYSVIYYATDSAGNVATSKAVITVLEKQTRSESEISASHARLNEECRNILENTLRLTDGMSEMEKLIRIFDYVRYESEYKDDRDGDKNDWVKAALNWIEEGHIVDCYGYFAIAKALLENAGFETVDVQKSDTSHSRHYWSLVRISSGWYHYDTSPRNGNGNFFCMVTDEQLENYAKDFAKMNPDRGRSHIWDKSLYPEVSKIVITDLNAEDDQNPYYKLKKDPDNPKRYIQVSAR